MLLQEWKNTHDTRRLPDRRTEECQGWAGGRRGGGAKPSRAPDSLGAKGGSRRAAGPELRPGSGGCSRPRVLPVSPAPRALLPAAPAPSAPPGGPDPARSRWPPGPRALETFSSNKTHTQTPISRGRILSCSKSPVLRASGFCFSFRCPGLVALRYARSSWTRDRTHVSCIGRRILYH